jgi:hypothetical protein
MYLNQGSVFLIWCLPMRGEGSYDVDLDVSARKP